MVVNDLGYPDSLRCNDPVKSNPVLVNGGAICTLSVDKSTIFVVAAECSIAYRSNTYSVLILPLFVPMGAKIFDVTELESFLNRRNLLCSN